MEVFIYLTDEELMQLLTNRIFSSNPNVIKKQVGDTIVWIRNNKPLTIG